MPTRDQIRQLLSLSPRERQVLSLVCEGLLYKEIAGRLEIKVSTVKAYMGRVFVKFGMEFFERKERYHYLKINYCPLLELDLIDETDEPDDENAEIKPVIPLPPRMQRVVDEFGEFLESMRVIEGELVEEGYETISEDDVIVLNPIEPEHDNAVNVLGESFLILDEPPGGFTKEDIERANRHNNEYENQDEESDSNLVGRAQDISSNNVGNNLRMVIRVVIVSCLLVITIGIVIFLVDHFRGLILSEEELNTTNVAVEISGILTGTANAGKTRATPTPSASPVLTSTQTPTKGMWEQEWDFLGFLGEAISDIADSNETIYLSISSHNHGIYKSNDIGKTWYAINNGLEELDIYNIHVVEENPNMLFAHGYTIWLTLNGGQSWANIGPFGDTQYESMAIDLTDGHLVFVTRRQSGLFRSIDTGQTWEQVSCSDECPSMGNLVSSPIENDFLMNYHNAYSSEIEYAYVTENGPMSWMPLANVGTSLYVHDFAFDFNNPSILYVATDFGIYHSIDKGGSWYASSNGIDRVEDQEEYYCGNVETAYWDSELVFAVCHEKLYLSENGGFSWTIMSSPEGLKFIHPLSDNRVIIGVTGEEGLYSYTLP